MSKRVCYNCQSEILPETEHYELNDQTYCVDCVEATPYTAHTYYVDGEYVGNSEDGECRHIEVYEDDYEEDDVA